MDAIVTVALDRYQIRRLFETGSDVYKLISEFDEVLGELVFAPLPRSTDWTSQFATSLDPLEQLFFNHCVVLKP